MKTGLDRPNLSGEVQEELRRLIIVGELVAGTRLNEVGLARRLQVSRTPIREALSQLVAEGFVHSIPRRGFFVASLSSEEILQLYPMRQLLDPEALRLAGRPSAAQLDQLSRLNQDIACAVSPRRLIELDDRWHMLLVAGCPNGILLDSIRHFMRRTLRYELAYMSDNQNVTVAIAEHEAILDCLREGDLEAACQRLRRNMETATGPLLEWFSSKHAGRSEPGDKDE